MLQKKLLPPLETGICDHREWQLLLPEDPSPHIAQLGLTMAKNLSATLILEAAASACCGLNG